jgi:hypothetical protein
LVIAAVSGDSHMIVARLWVSRIRDKKVGKGSGTPKKWGWRPGKKAFDRGNSIASLGGSPLILGKYGAAVYNMIMMRPSGRVKT